MVSGHISSRVRHAHPAPGHGGTQPDHGSSDTRHSADISRPPASHEWPSSVRRRRRHDASRPFTHSRRSARTRPTDRHRSIDRSHGTRTVTARGEESAGDGDAGAGAARVETAAGAAGDAAGAAGAEPEPPERSRSRRSGAGAAGAESSRTAPMKWRRGEDGKIDVHQDALRTGPVGKVTLKSRAAATAQFVRFQLLSCRHLH